MCELICPFQRTTAALAFLLVLMLIPRATYAFQLVPSATPKITRTVEPNGVIRWESPSSGRDPRFFEELRSITGLPPSVISDDPNRLPFGRSIALLVGVGKYTILEQLPGVANSVRRLREYLLGPGGFDVVYEISDTDDIANPVATPDTVRTLMHHEFKMLNSSDRLLFYFAGHGTDESATTGYLLFRDASKDGWDKNYLATSEIRDWSQLIPTRHILFLLDACSAGYGFNSDNPQSVPPDVGNLMLLGERKSREIVTAGTGKQDTFDVDEDTNNPMTVFGAALMDALEHSNASGASMSLITLNQVFTDLSNQVFAFANRKGKENELKPGRYPLVQDGQFLFLNPLAKNKASKEMVDEFERLTETNLALDRSVLELRNAAQERLSTDPVWAYVFASAAFALRPGPATTKLILSAVSKIDMLFSLQIDRYAIEDVKEPFILLRTKQNDPDKRPVHLIFDMTSFTIKGSTVKADHAWIVPFGSDWRLLTMSLSDAASGLTPTYQLWDSTGNAVGESVRQAGSVPVKFIGKQKVAILSEDRKELVWDLSDNSKKLVLLEGGKLCDYRNYYTYRSLASRSDGYSALPCNAGLVLADENAAIQGKTYTPIDFDPGFSNAKWSSDGQYLALKDESRGRLGIWDPRRGSFLWLDRSNLIADSYSWSTTGHLLAFSERTTDAANITVETVSGEAPEETRRKIYTADVPVKTMAFSKSDKDLALGTWEGTIRVIDLATGKIIASAFHKDVTQLFYSSDGLFSSNGYQFRAWSLKPSPASHWKFQSANGRLYRPVGVVDSAWKWMAVPFVDGGTQAGVEVRDLRNGESFNFSIPNVEDAQLVFSADATWLIIETGANVRVCNMKSGKYYDFGLQGGDHRYVNLRIEANAVLAQAIRSTSDNKLFFSDYVIQLNTDHPMLNVKAAGAGPSDAFGPKTALLLTAIQGWDTLANIYKYQMSGLVPLSYSDWVYEAQCRDEPMRRDCDIQFIPADPARLVEMYDRLIWHPTSVDIQHSIQ
jgi:WD40 repeat protein